PHPVWAGCVRLSLARAHRGNLVVHLSHPGGAGAASGWRQPCIRPRAGLSGTANPYRRGAVRRCMRRPWRSLSTARLHPLLYSRHDRRPWLDRARARGFCFVAPRTACGRCLSVWSGDDPAVARARGRFRHSLAADVVLAVSRHHFGAGRDLAGAWHVEIGFARVAWSGVRTGPLTDPAARVDGRRALPGLVSSRPGTWRSKCERLLFWRLPRSLRPAQASTTHPPSKSSRSGSFILGRSAISGGPISTRSAGNTWSRSSLQGRDHVPRKRQRGSGL